MTCNGIYYVFYGNLNYIGCRNTSAGTELITSIRQKDGITGGRADVLSLDLMSLDSVRDFATQVLGKNIPIHILINNGT